MFSFPCSSSPSFVTPHPPLGTPTRLPLVLLLIPHTSQSSLTLLNTKLLPRLCLLLTMDTHLWVFSLFPCFSIPSQSMELLPIFPGTSPCLLFHLHLLVSFIILLSYLWSLVTPLASLDIFHFDSSLLHHWTSFLFIMLHYDSFLMTHSSTPLYINS